MIAILVRALHSLFTEQQGLQGEWPEPALVQEGTGSTIGSLAGSSVSSAKEGDGSPGVGAGEHGHYLNHLFPGAVSQPELLIGHHDSITGNWLDGILTAYLRNAKKVCYFNRQARGH